MAQLHRFVKLKDRTDTQVLTFLLPHTLVEERPKDNFEREFVYGYQKWLVSFGKTDKHIGAFITLKNPTEGLKCRIDLSFTFLNREHFTRNESYSEKAFEFTVDHIIAGRRTFISISDLLTRDFCDENGDYLVELELRHLETFYTYNLEIPNTRDWNTYETPRFETSYFNFGTFDWNLTVYPHGVSVDRANTIAIYMNRMTSFSHYCKVNYRLTLGEGERALQSHSLEQLVDVDGLGEGYEVSANVHHLVAKKNRLRIKVSLQAVTAISQVQIKPLSTSRNKAQFFDRDRQAWQLESDMVGRFLALRLYYTDINHVPRHFSRYVTFGASVVPSAQYGSSAPVKCLSTPYSNYYVQADTDSEGFNIFTNIPVMEIREQNGQYLDSEGRLTVQLEWIDSHLLFQSKYHRMDDVTKRHKHQMWKEIQALQTENYALEKQLHTYQKSIAIDGPGGEDPIDHLFLND